MSRKLRNMMLFCCCGLVLSCNSTSSEKEAQTEQVSLQRARATEIPEKGKGQKWKVNAEMLPAITEGENLVHEYVQTKGSDYKKLADELKEKNTSFIHNCKMEGASHNALHEWLHPHLELTKQLEHSGTTEEADEIIQKLVTSYETFHQYFE